MPDECRMAMAPNRRVPAILGMPEKDGAAHLLSVSRASSCDQRTPLVSGHWRCSALCGNMQRITFNQPGAENLIGGLGHSARLMLHADRQRAIYSWQPHE
jgi:hypothetical protein